MSKFNVGDEVRLTGILWGDEMPERGTVHIIDEVDADGAAFFRTPGNRWRISEPDVDWKFVPHEHFCAELVSHGETDTPAMAAARIRGEVQTIKLPVPKAEPGAIKTPEQVAADEIDAAVENMTPDEAAEFLRVSATMATHWMVAAIEADRAQRFVLPPVLAGVIEPADGGIFVNERGDYLVEPIGDETLELIYVAADGSTSTGRGEWETGWEA